MEETVQIACIMGMASLMYTGFPTETVVYSVLAISTILLGIRAERTREKMTKTPEDLAPN